MPLLDTIQDTIHKIMPQKKDSIPLQSSMTGGIGNGHATFDDNVRVQLAFALFHNRLLCFPHGPTLSFWYIVCPVYADKMNMAYVILSAILHYAASIGNLWFPPSRWCNERLNSVTQLLWEVVGADSLESIAESPLPLTTDHSNLLSPPWGWKQQAILSFCSSFL